MQFNRHTTIEHSKSYVEYQKFHVSLNVRVVELFFLFGWFVVLKIDSSTIVTGNPLLKKAQLPA